MKTISSLLKIILLLVALSNSVHAFYDPGQGRWVSRDPIEEQAGPNLYGYVENDGVRKMDFLGMKTITSSAPVYDPTPAGWVPGDRPTTVVVANVNARLTYPDETCKGTAKLSFSILSRTIGTQGYLRPAVIEALHEPGNDCSFVGAGIGVFPRTGSTIGLSEESRDQYGPTSISGGIDISLPRCRDCVCDTCLQGKIKIGLKGTTQANTSPSYRGRYITGIIYYKISLKSPAGLLNYRNDCKYDYDESLLKIEVYGPQNIKGR
jgi:uncharacterized protein RhaS with RHS repeats